MHTQKVCFDILSETIIYAAHRIRDTSYYTLAVEIKNQCRKGRGK